MGIGATVLFLIGLGALGAVLSPLYLRAYARAGHDDWGNYLALMPMFSMLFPMSYPLGGWPMVSGLLGMGLLGTPALLAVRRIAGRSGKAGPS
jgi:hypothetical protein